MGEISSLPDEIIYNILVLLPLNNLVKLKYVCKRWNRLVSDPYYRPRVGDRKVLLPFAPIINVDVLDEENDTTRSIVPFSSSPFAKPKFASTKLKHKDVTFAGSCNGIVLLVINHYQWSPWLHERARMVLYNPLTGENKLIPDNLHSKCTTSYKHVYGFGYGSTPDDLKIFRFRGWNNKSVSTSNYKKRHSFDVFSLKTNSWDVLKFVQNAYRLNDVGTFANGSLYWIANSRDNKDREDQSRKIVALDVKNMVVSDIHLPFLDRSSYESCVLGTLHGSLCIFAAPKRNQFAVWVMMAGEGSEKSWFEASSFTLNLNPEWRYRYGYYRPLISLDDGMVLISIENELQKLVIYNTMNHSHKVIKISERPSYFRRSHGIEYVESLVSPSSLFNNIA